MERRNVDGPEILVNMLSQPRVPDKFRNLWQYHSSSDHHSKVAWDCCGSGW